MKLGISNRFFYYTATGAGTFDQRCSAYLKNNLDVNAFNKALIETVNNYPEYKQRIIIEKNKFVAIENEEYPVLFIDGKNYKYASKEVHYYTYFFNYHTAEKKLELCIYHGVADGLSIINFFTSIFYFYAKNIGKNFSNEEMEIIKTKIRLSKDDAKSFDEMEMFDPYMKCHNVDAKPKFKYVCEDAFYFSHKQYDDEANYIHSYQIKISNSAFLEKTKNIGTSFAPLLIYTISNAIANAYDTMSKPIVAMLPLDCRRIFNVKTMVNFADGIFIPYYEIDKKRSIVDVCNALKKYIVEQQTCDNMAEIMTNKIKKLNEYENGNKTIDEIVKQNQKLPPANAKRQVTYPMSYSGKVDFGETINELITNFDICAYVRSYSVVACNYGDNLNIKIGLRTDDMTFPNCIKNGFEKLGLNVEFIDNGKMIGNILDIRNLY